MKLLASLILATSAAFLSAASLAAEAPAAVPPPAVDAPRAPGPLQTAVLAGGCFWGVQGVYEHMTGVHRVLSGYAGGQSGTAHYEQVGTGQTGHAESVEITYDPQQVTYGQILQVFFSVAHDPTQLNRQGPDSGPQYRSAIFYADDLQKKVAASYIAQLTEAGVFHAPIVTKVSPLKGFYRAEDYHQDFLVRNPTYPYIAYNDLPKIRNFQQTLPSLYQAAPVTLGSPSR